MTTADICTHPPGERRITRYPDGGFLNVPKGERIVCDGCGRDFGSANPRNLTYPTTLEAITAATDRDYIVSVGRTSGRTIARRDGAPTMRLAYDDAEAGFYPEYWTDL